MFNTSRKLVWMTAIVIASATGSIQAQTREWVECVMATHNNNTPRSKQLDDGKSFGLSWECKNHTWIIWARADGYTRNTKYDLTTGITDGDRIDHGQAYVLRSVAKIWTNTNTLDIYAGIWYQWTGELGGANLQNTWHDEWPSALTKNQYNQKYSFSNKYEVYRSGHPISWSTPDIRVHVEGNSVPFYWDGVYRLSGYGTMDAKIALNQKYGETAVQITAGIRAELNSVTIELWGTIHLYRELPRSDVIQAARNNPRSYLSARVSGILWKAKGDDGATIAPYIQIQWTKQDNLQGTLGLQISY